jgi:hypothetical protein
MAQREKVEGGMQIEKSVSVYISRQMEHQNNVCVRLYIDCPPEAKDNQEHYYM